MSDLLTIYTSVPHLSTASLYYRLMVPLLTASELGLNVKAVIDRMEFDTAPEQRFHDFSESDLVLIYQPVGPIPQSNIQGIQSFIPSKRDDGWKWPPTVVIETDDNLFNVSPFNPAFKGLGFRDMEGREIPAFVGGRPMEIGSVQDGIKRVHWRHGTDGFDILRNRHTVNGYKAMLKMADAVTCSTDAVKAAVEKEVLPRRIKVFPNMVRFNDYEQVDLREDPSQIKILWQGGAAHYEDWYPLREALGRITKKYPQVHWIIWGAQWHWVNELIPPHRFTYKDWCPYHEYRLRLTTIGHDISLAPLQENVFNQCRSAIKFYEATVLKKPAATLAQNSGAYKHEIQDGETGMLFEDSIDFEEKLCTLIENEAERKRLAANAKDWVSENRDARKLVPGWVSYWRELREIRKREQPHVSDEQWAEIEAQAKAEQEQEDKHLAEQEKELQPA